MTSCDCFQSGDPRRPTRPTQLTNFLQVERLQRAFLDSRAPRADSATEGAMRPPGVSAGGCVPRAGKRLGWGADQRGEACCQAWRGEQATAGVGAASARSHGVRGVLHGADADGQEGLPVANALSGEQFDRKHGRLSSVLCPASVGAWRHATNARIDNKHTECSAFI